MGHEQKHEQEKVEGVDVANPTGDFTRGYERSDMERLYHDAKPHS